jgi:hypothetical protein
MHVTASIAQIRHGYAWNVRTYTESKVKVAIVIGIAAQVKESVVNT